MAQMVEVTYRQCGYARSHTHGFRQTPPQSSPSPTTSGASHRTFSGFPNLARRLTLSPCGYDFAPVADAGPAQTVNPFVTVTLDATGTTDLDE